MAYLLDTSTLSFILNGNRTVYQRMRTAGATEPVYSSAISEGELVFGALGAGKERRGELRDEISQLLADLAAVLPVTREVALSYARLMRDLASRGQMIGVNDIWIAATAMSAGMTLVTSDSGFRRVRGLRLEDWLEA